MSMSFIVASCLHIDCDYGGHMDKEHGVNSNWVESLSQLRKIVRACNKRKVDYLVINGDLFHTGRPTPEAVYRTRKILDELEGTEVILEPGNHDLSGINSSHADPLTAYMTQAKWCHSVVTEPGVLDLGGFALALYPWHRVAGSSQLDEVSEEVARNVRRMSQEVADMDMPSMFLGHLTTKEVSENFAKRGSETVMATGLEAVVDHRHLDEGSWDTYALGHIHTRQPIGTRGVYTGSTYRVTFNEEREKKGVYHYVFNEDGKFKRTFLNLGGRKLVTADVSNGSLVDPAKHENLKARDRFKLILPHGTDLLDMHKETQRLVEHLEGIGVEVLTPNAAPPKAKKLTTKVPITEETSPRESVKAYLEEQEDLTDKDVKRVSSRFAAVVEGKS